MGLQTFLFTSFELTFIISCALCVYMRFFLFFSVDPKIKCDKTNIARIKIKENKNKSQLDRHWFNVVNTHKNYGKE